ncbi:MAG: OmpA family protein, partial [Thermodesulfobacteriota bacterium]
MLKRFLLTCMIVVVSCSPAFAIEVPKEAQDMMEKPQATAYTSKIFNSILMACGVSALGTDAVAGVPASYAKVAGDNVKFNNDSMVYPPKKYHAILTAYGLQIDPEEVSARLGASDYATVKDGNVVFGKISTAYTKSEWINILACYTAGGIGDKDGDGVTDDKDACPNTPKGVAVDERGCWTEAAKFLFDLDSAVLSSDAKSVLDNVKGIFDENPGMVVQIDGHTCDLGAAAYNQNLSERRAQAVEDYLLNKAGIGGNRLSTKGYGETRPAYPNTSEANR